jgi:hypothetical protein
MNTAAPLQNLTAKPGTPTNSSHADLLQQRKCACGAPTASLTGECAECKSKKRLHTKLAIGASHDPLEREADRVADQVLAAPENHAISPAPPRIQRFTGQAAGRALETPASVDRALSSAGSPLEPALRQDMERRFGHDFSRVRVHSGGTAVQSARDVNAHAYAVGQNIVFGAGQFAPATYEGRRLLAHELTHVVQQSGANPQGARLMRSPNLDSTIKMRHRVKKGETVFQVPAGGLLVTITAGWGPTTEWIGEGDRTDKDDARPACSEAPLNVTLTKKNTFFDDEYGTCEFETGTTVTKQWTNLPDGDYFLTFYTGNTNPNCMLEGTVKASSAIGLTGETCTKLPPGPLEVLHDALALAGLVPALGAIPDAIDTGIYVVQGDWENAGLSAIAIIPIFGDAASLGKIGARTIARIEGKAVVKTGKTQIAKGLNAAKAAKALGLALRRPTYKALRASAAIDERLLDMVLLHRRQLVEAGAGFGAHNIAVIKVLIDGKPALLSARNTVHELHSEARLIGQIDEMLGSKKTVEVLQIFSERVPCTKAGCMQAINARFPKADVFFSVSEDLAASAGSKAEALKIVYGLKP